MPRQRAKERACDNAIKKTLAYRAVFESSLSKFQLYTYLISKKQYEKEFLEKSLNRLVKNKTIRKKKGKYYISTTKAVSWQHRYTTTIEILERNAYALKAIACIPWIKSINVTGSLGAYNATKSSDIDVFIITEKKRLWVTRLFVVIILKILSKYPIQGDDRERICPNILVDERNLTWPKEHQNIYVANEITMMQPIYDKDQTYFKFIKANKWIFRYFKNFKVEVPDTFANGKQQSPLMDKIENLLMNIQLKKMKKKTTEITKRGFIHFNVKDSSYKTLKEFKSTLKKLEIKS